MAGETEGQEPRAAPATGVDMAAAALALGGASREKADTFLDEQVALTRKQNRLADLQAEELSHELKLRVWSLQLHHFSSVLKLAFEVSLALITIALAWFIGAAVWNASQANGLVVEALSVPPKFSEAGITGEVVADDLTARIDAIRTIAVNNSLTSSRDVRKDSTEDIKVEIPETGVSLGQAWRYLRLWLGHERHLSGNLRLTSGGNAALTVALDGERVLSVAGPTGDLDKLEQEAAEQIFAKVDPINIVIYLLAERRDGEALASAARAAREADNSVERASAYSLWSGTTRTVTGDMKLALSRAQMAANINPKLLTAQLELMSALVLIGHDEEALRHAQAMREFKEQDQPLAQRGQGFAQIQTAGEYIRDAFTGSFMLAASEDLCPRCSQSGKFATQAEFAARAHDETQSRALAAKALAAGSAAAMRGTQIYDSDVARAEYFSKVDLEDWRAAVDSAHAYESDIKSDPSKTERVKAVRLQVEAAPLLAYVLARAADPVGAQELIETTPSDCYDCIRVRGQIASEAHQWGRADYWFARAVKAGPDIPFAYTDWGQALLARGQPDAAIAKFTLANRKGPHFADALEIWGEALMAKNQSHLALAKFAEANKYAPNWGRLHLKWGEALFYAGRKDEAKQQFAAAMRLELPTADKAELERMRSAHG